MVGFMSGRDVIVGEATMSMSITVKVTKKPGLVAPLESLLTVTSLNLRERGSGEEAKACSSTFSPIIECTDGVKPDDQGSVSSSTLKHTHQTAQELLPAILYGTLRLVEGECAPTVGSSCPHHEHERHSQGLNLRDKGCGEEARACSSPFLWSVIVVIRVTLEHVTFLRIETKKSTNHSRPALERVQRFCNTQTRLVEGEGACTPTVGFMSSRDVTVGEATMSMTITVKGSVSSSTLKHTHQTAQEPLPAILCDLGSKQSLSASRWQEPTRFDVVRTDSVSHIDGVPPLDVFSSE
ncbi:hypothetical protein F2Q69_00020851 [Brassica cretica]|uniref:Uncharacterized protein n=1 Tax=Brassica cretica TaxID=69181 RepID=A0A8S9QE02_BRACR|nr:hypothetical protein F2Q69_00020851 [Brassica cretica]